MRNRRIQHVYCSQTLLLHHFFCILMRNYEKIIQNLSIQMHILSSTQDKSYPTLQFSSSSSTSTFQPGKFIKKIKFSNLIDTSKDFDFFPMYSVDLSYIPYFF